MYTFEQFEDLWKRTIGNGKSPSKKDYENYKKNPTAPNWGRINELGKQIYGEQTKSSDPTIADAQIRREIEADVRSKMDKHTPESVIQQAIESAVQARRSEMTPEQREDKALGWDQPYLTDDDKNKMDPDKAASDWIEEIKNAGPLEGETEEQRRERQAREREQGTAGKILEGAKNLPQAAKDWVDGRDKEAEQKVGDENARQNMTGQTEVSPLELDEMGGKRIMTGSPTDNPETAEEIERQRRATIGTNREIVGQDSIYDKDGNTMENQEGKGSGNIPKTEKDSSKKEEQDWNKDLFARTFGGSKNRATHNLRKIASALGDGFGSSKNQDAMIAQARSESQHDQNKEMAQMTAQLQKDLGRDKYKQMLEAGINLPKMAQSAGMSATELQRYVKAVSGGSMSIPEFLSGMGMDKSGDIADFLKGIFGR